jgi:hypothetical protein
MTKARWTRWGRGMAEGWSLEIGAAFGGAVVRQERTSQPTTWLASVNASYLGEYFERSAAMARVEEVIEDHMRAVLADWELYRAAAQEKARRSSA